MYQESPEPLCLGLPSQNFLGYNLSYKHTDLKSVADVLGLYYQYLTIEPPFTGQPLANEEVFELRKRLDRLYVAYQAHSIRLRDIEGIWCLLASVSGKRSGLELYLAFEQMMGEDEVNEAEEIKQEEGEFNHGRYFKNGNAWKQHQKFVRAVRVLDRRVSSDKGIQRQHQLFQIMDQDANQILEHYALFEQKYLKFKQEIEAKMRQEARARISRDISMTFNEPFMSGAIMSDPGPPPNIIQTMNFEEFLKIQSSNHQLLSKPAKKVNSVHEGCKLEDIGQVPNNENLSENVSTITIGRKKNLTAPSQPTRKPPRHYVRRERDQPNYKPRPKRMDIIERYYALQPKQNLAIQKIKKTKQKQQEARKKKKRVDRIALRKVVQYYSDDDDSEQKHHRKSVRKERLKKKKYEQSGRKCMSQESGAEAEMINEDFESDSSSSDSMLRIMPRNRLARLKNKLIQPKRAREADVEQESDWNRPRSIDKNRSNMMIVEPRLVVVDKKRDGSLQFLKGVVSQRRESKGMEQLSSLEVRRLEVMHVQYEISFSPWEYMSYLCALKGSQIPREVRRVGVQMLNRNKRIGDFDIAIKILSLRGAAHLKKEQAPQWQQQLPIFVQPMLEHLLTYNFYVAVTEILNNLMVSARNEDLTALQQQLILFSALFNAASGLCEGQLIVQVVQKIYSLMEKSMMAKSDQSTQTLPGYLCLPDPKTTAIDRLGFNLAPAHRSICMFISSLVFEQIVLRPLGNDNSNLQQKFLVKAIEVFSQREQWQAGDIYQLTHHLRVFYLTYQPPLTSPYFQKIVGVLQVSLERLMMESVRSQDSVEAVRHVEFLKQIYRQFITEQTQGPVNSKQLQSRLTIGTGIKRNCERFQSGISWVVYSSVLGVMLEFQIFRTDSLFIANSLKYLTMQISPKLTELIPKINPNLSASLFELTARIYEAVVPVPGEPSSYKSSKAEDGKYRQVCDFIQKLHCELERKHEKMTRYLETALKDSCAKSTNQQVLGEKSIVRKAKENLFRCEDQIGSFIDHIFMSEGNSRSVAHSFFTLDFILQRHCFIKYYHRTFAHGSSRSELAIKCNRLLHQLFYIVPSFVHLLQNAAKLSPQSSNMEEDSQGSSFSAFLKVFAHQGDLARQCLRRVLSASGERRQVERNLQTQLWNKPEDNFQVIEGLASWYGMQLMATTELQDGKRGQELTFFNILKEALSPSSTTAVKIRKATMMLTCVYRQMIDYLQRRDQKQLWGNSSGTRIRGHVIQSLLMRWIEETVQIIMLGFTLNNSSRHYNPQLYSLLGCIRRLKAIELSQVNTAPNLSGFTHFIFSVQSFEDWPSILTILDGLLQAVSEFSGADLHNLTRGVNRILSGMQPVMRHLLGLEEDKSVVTVQCLRILIFILQWPELLTNCIRFYLIEMRVKSKGQSLIGRISRTEDNMLILLQFFNCVNNRQQNPYQIKDTMPSYINSITTSAATEEYFLREVSKTCLAIRGALNKDRSLIEIACDFMGRLLGRVCEPLMSFSQGNSTKLIPRFKFVLQVTRTSTYERRVYERFISDHWRDMEKFSYHYIRSNKKQTYSSFEDILNECCIGEYSDVWDIKKLLGVLLKQNSQKELCKSGLLSLLSCLKVESERRDVYLVAQWCQQELTKLNKFWQMKEWMSLMEDQDL